MSTRVRHAVLSVTMLTAFLMYLDRACLAWMLDSESFKAAIPLDAHQKDLLKSAFFWAYALAQVPAGWLAERFGKRALMTVLILLWSGFTALAGFADGFALLLFARMGCGLAEAGAYPISGSLLSRWANVNWRGFASGLVSLGGRLGFVLAPIITAYLILGMGNWRWAGWIYGATGVCVAAAFWRTFRETPEEHPACNEAEREYLASGRPATTGAKVAFRFPWRHVLTDRSLWLMCAYQLLTNYGWAFVINSMSTYLKDVRKVSDATNGQISTLTLFIGLGGLLAGGLVTDFCMRRYGVRLGRLIPLVSTRFIAALMLLCCLQVENIWLLAVCLGLMTFAADAGLPATWAWAQDVGGRQVAPIFGWANMWGNFGAALQPLVNGWIILHFDPHHDWHASFIAGAAAFVLAGVLAFGINAAKPVVPEE